MGKAKWVLIFFQEIFYVLFPVCVSIKSDGCESEVLSSSIMAHCLTLNIIFILYFPSIHQNISVEYMISDTRLLVERKKSSNFVNIFMRFSQLLSCYQKLDSKNFLLFQKVDHISSNKRLNCKMISAFEKKTNGLTKYSSTQ